MNHDNTLPPALLTLQPLRLHLQRPVEHPTIRLPLLPSHFQPLQLFRRKLDFLCINRRRVGRVVGSDGRKESAVGFADEVWVGEEDEFVVADGKEVAAVGCAQYNQWGPKEELEQSLLGSTIFLVAGMIG